MKKKNIVIIFIVVLLIGSCTAVGDTLDMAGTLGSASSVELNCSENYAKEQLKELLTKSHFKVLEKDSVEVDWWKRNGYDFLTYQCINIHGRLYMITFTSESSTETQLSIRSYYNRKKEEWMFAKEFTSSEKKKAKKALEYLLNQINGCN